MDLFEQISGEIKKAMLAREKVRLEALRGIKKEFIEAKTAKGNNGELTDAVALKILAKMAKQRKDSAQIFQEQNREDLAKEELEELVVIEAFLPKQLSDEEIEKEVKVIISEVGAVSMKDMGKVMGLASKKMAGKADGGKISCFVKQLLSLPS